MRSNKACGLLMAAIAAAMLMAGCQKDTVTIKARIIPFGDGKVIMNGLNPQWQNGDKIRVNNYEQVATISDSGNTTTVTVLASATYKAVYPAEYVTAVAGYKFNLTLPQKQIYTTDGSGNQVVKAPLGAYSQDPNLNFTPLGALLAINITNNFTNSENDTPDIIIDTIKVTALGGSSLWGDATVQNITLNDHKYVMAEGTGSNSITLTGEDEYEGMNKSLAHGTSCTCYVFTPEVSGERFEISVWAHDANHNRYAFSYKQAENMSYTLSRGGLANVAYTADASHCTQTILPAGAVDGLFSVSSTQQVYFSKGNLQWSHTGGGSAATSHSVNGGGTADGTWRFAEHQYDVIGYTSGNTTVPGRETQADWIDLFPRGCSGYDYQYPYLLTNVPACSTGMAGSNYDWGIYNAISNGGNTPNLWHTLSAAEWEYVISIRQNASSLVKKATVNSVSGYILLPDAWRWRGSVADYVNQTSFDSTQWSYMEEFGAVFLPRGGRLQLKFNNNGFEKIDGINDGCYYWTTTDTTTTDKNGNKKYYYTTVSLSGDNAVNFTSTSNEYKTDNNKFLYAVRLVKNYEAPTTNTTSK